jgi:lysophospholipase L1-like esterase
VPELAAADLRLDGVNFSTAGHAKVAEHVAPAVLDLIEAH